MITVIGLGFVGLATALGFSEKGYRVYGYDIDVQKTGTLRNGRLPFHEPYLEDRLNFHLANNFIIASDLAAAVQDSSLIFFCVGTPAKDDGEADLTFLSQAVRTVLNHIPRDEFKVLVIKSTVPPSTTKNRIRPLLESQGYQVGVNIGLANNPEFLREGYAWEDFIRPDRIVIGHEDERSGVMVEEAYRVFDASIFRVSWNSAEYIKYLSNTLLATLISFANEQSMIARSFGDIDIKQSFEVLHLDKRWYGLPAGMQKYVYPGCGFGGYCLPKDTEALVKQAQHHGYAPQMLQSVLTVNKQIKETFVRALTKQIDKKEIIGILGLAFKPNSDDIRNTPALDIIMSLVQSGYTNIIAYDPLAVASFQETYSFPIEYSSSLGDLLGRADHIIILTAWQEFIDHKEWILQKHVYDLRYIF